MRLSELARILGLVELTPALPGASGAGGGIGGAGASGAPDSAGDTQATAAADPDITRGYASDLLSDVLANAPAGGVLITLQVHMNVIAVAGHADLVAVIFSSGRKPDDEVIERAAQEGIALFASADDTFDLVGRLYSLDVRGASA